MTDASLTYDPVAQSIDTTGYEFAYRDLTNPNRRIALRLVGKLDPLSPPDDEASLPTIILRAGHGDVGQQWSACEESLSALKHADSAAIALAFERFRVTEKRLAQRHGSHVIDYGDSAEGLLERWLHVFHGWSEVSVSGYHGYVQSDWGVVVRGYSPSFRQEHSLPADHKRQPGEGHDLTSWARGDVWIAQYEELVTWTSVSSKGEQRRSYEWRASDSRPAVTVYGSVYEVTSGTDDQRFNPNEDF